MSKRPYILPSPKSRRKIRQTLQDWLSVKNPEPYYQYLEILTHLTQSVFRQEQTINNHPKLTQEIKNQLTRHYHPLLDQLTHSITLLNHPYRVQQLSGYESTREDILSAAALLQIDFNPKSMLYAKTEFIYWELLKIYRDDTFSTKEASQQLHIQTRTLRNHLISLLHADKIQLAHIGKRNTHYYKLIY